MAERVEKDRASYRAHQFGHDLHLFASGVHPSRGYKMFFDDLRGGEGNADFVFLCVPPSIRDGRVSPFQHEEVFEASSPLDGIVIEDADGLHRVRVDRFPQAEEDEARALVAGVALEAEALGCDVCVRQTVAVWANNSNFSNSDTLGEVYLRGNCNNGALSQLFRAIQERCGATPPSLSCSMTVRELIRFTCP